MDTSSALGIIAFALQFTILAGTLAIHNCRIQRIERAKCRCCSQEHPLL